MLRNRLILEEQFFDLQMSIGEFVSDPVSRVECLVSQLSDIGISIPAESVVGKIVSGFGKKYQSFVSSWVATDPEKQTLENLISRLLAQEQMLNRYGPQTSTALNTNASYKEGKRKDSKVGKKGSKKKNCRSQVEDDIP